MKRLWLCALLAMPLSVFVGSSLAESSQGVQTTGSWWFQQGQGERRTVAIRGDLAIVGVPHALDPRSRHDAVGLHREAAHVFRLWYGWYEEGTLLPSDGDQSRGFGLSVAIDGDRAIVGAPGDAEMGSDAGAAYVFRFRDRTWVQEAKLVAGDAAPYREFGSSVSIDGDVALIGAVRGTPAYVFRLQDGSWVEEARLTVDAAGWHGYSSSLSSDLAIVGGRANHAGLDTGLTVLFRDRSGVWEQEALWDGGGVTTFGRAVAVSGSHAIVGVPSGEGRETGVVEVFHLSATGWAREDVLVAPVGDLPYVFGSAVSLQGDVAIVGSAVEAGRAPMFESRVFRRDAGSSLDDGTWVEEARLSYGIETGDRFGASVAIQGDLAIAGVFAPPANRRDPNWGWPAHVVRHEAGTWSHAATLTTRIAGPAGCASTFEALQSGRPVRFDRVVDGLGGSWVPTERFPLTILRDSETFDWELIGADTTDTLVPGRSFVVLNWSTTVRGTNNYDESGALLECVDDRVRGAEAAGPLILGSDGIVESQHRSLPDDPFCCPSLLVTTRLQFQGRRFVRGAPRVQMDGVVERTPSPTRSLAGYYRFQVWPVQFHVLLFPSGACADGRGNIPRGENEPHELTWRYGLWTAEDGRFRCGDPYESYSRITPVQLELRDGAVFAITGNDRVPVDRESLEDGG